MFDCSYVDICWLRIGYRLEFQGSKDDYFDFWRASSHQTTNIAFHLADSCIWFAVGDVYRFWIQTSNTKDVISDEIIQNLLQFFYFFKCRWRRWWWIDRHCTRFQCPVEIWNVPLLLLTLQNNIWIQLSYGELIESVFGKILGLFSSSVFHFISLYASHIRVTKQLNESQIIIY